MTDKNETLFGGRFIPVKVRDGAEAKIKACQIPLAEYENALRLLDDTSMPSERHNSNDQPVRQNYRLMAIAITSLLCLVTFCTRLAVTAWFPEQMHASLEHFHGGISAGIFATSLLAPVTGIYYKFARSF